MGNCRAAGRCQDQCRSVRETVADFLTGLLIFLAVFALAALDARPARPDHALAVPMPLRAPLHIVTAPASLSPEDVTSGALLVGPARAHGGAALKPARLLGADVQVSIAGTVARTTFIQTFRTPSGSTQNGVYVLPLPAGAAVDAVTMQIGERSIQSEIAPRAKAKRKTRSLQPGATPANAPERPAPTLFMTPLSDIAPGETVRIRIAYQQTLRFAAGGLSLRIPLVATPSAEPRLRAVRFDPRRGPGMRIADNLATLKMTIKAGFPLGEVTSPTHAVTVKRLGDEGAVVSLATPWTPMDKDFELIWKPKDLAQPVARLLRETKAPADYLLAMITPPARAPASAVRPREVTFVVDISGSMKGAAILQVRENLARAISRLGERDRFNVIAFNAAFETLFAAPKEANADTKALAKQFIARLQAVGGTRMMQPLIAALRDATPDDASRVRQIVLITDGAIAHERQLFSEIAVKRGRSRLFLIGIGPAPNRYLLRRAAELGRGGFIHIESGAELADSMERFLARLERPLVTDLKIDWPKGAQADMWPDPLPDLYAGQPIVVSARAGAVKGPITVSGAFDGKPWSAALAVSEAKPGDGVGKLWARRKLASLEALRLSQPDPATIDQEIEQIAMAHGLASRMTLLVAIETASAAPSPAGSPLADEISPPPDRHETAIARAIGPAPARAAAAQPPPSTDADPLIEAARDRSIEGTPVGQPARMLVETRPEPWRGVEDGSPTAFWNRMTVIAVMAVLFAAMCALTLGLWRHLERLYASPKRIRGAT